MRLPKLPNKNYQRWLVIVLLLTLLLIGNNPKRVNTRQLSKLIDSHLGSVGTLLNGTYRVIQVNDGDTITVAMNGRNETIRFIGVDTPEIQDPRKPVQCFGYAASNFTKQLIANNTVKLEADSLNTNRDRYGRLLRYVYLPDGTLVNAKIIQEGYGFAYTGFPFEKLDEFKQYQTQAREQSKGLWKDCKPNVNQFGGFDSNPDK